jgi:hypothetical protein
MSSPLIVYDKVVVAFKRQNTTNRFDMGMVRIRIVEGGWGFSNSGTFRIELITILLTRVA